MRYIGFLILSFVLFGCVNPEPQKSDLLIPSAFNASSSNASSDISPLWWQTFDSLTLNALMDKAAKNNQDILIAYENIEQARLQLGISEADYLPSISLSAGSSAGRNEPHASDAYTTKSTSANARINYEIDLWGKIRASVEAAQARFDATKYDYDAARLSLFAGVADSYFTFLSLEERLIAAKENLNISEQLMKIVDAKYTAGAVSLIDVSRQKTTLLSQQANVESLQLQLSQAKNALSVLTGDFPQNFSVQKDDFWSLNLPIVDAGLSSELLLNRPDIASANASLQAANAAIKVANAQRFPSFSLTGSGGVSSDELLSFHDPLSVLSIALNAAFTLFDGGRLKDLTQIEIIKAKTAVQNYNKVVLNAFQESEDALLALSYQNSQKVLQEEILNESERSLNIASLQYRYGTSDLTTLLDAQSKYFSAKDAQVSQRLNHLKSLVTLYRVLGGGWNETR